MQSLRVLPIIFLLFASLILVNLVPIRAQTTNTDTTGGATGAAGRGVGPAYGFPITITESGTLQSIGVNWADTAAGNVRVALYTPGSNKPASLLVDSGTVPITTIAGWQDVSVSSLPTVSVTPGIYWVAIQISVAKTVYTISASRSYYYLAGGFGPFNPTWSANSNQDTQDQWNMRVTYSTGPPPPPPSDFTISASQTSQTVGASSTASYTLNIQYSSTLSATVSLAVTAGCPTGVTCTVAPNSITGSTSVTLSVPTLLTTPSGTTSVIVTASTAVLSHTVTVQLTVNGPASFPITVHSGATQVVITISWTGTGTAPVTLVGPGGSPTLSESGAAVYDRTSIPTGSSTPTYIHRVTFTLSPSPSSTQTWTVLISIAVPSGYTVTIEVS